MELHQQECVGERQHKRVITQLEIFGVVSQTMASNALLEGHVAKGSASKGLGPKSSFCKLQMLLNLALELGKKKKKKMGLSQNLVRAEGFYSSYSSASNFIAVILLHKQYYSVELQLLI